MTRIPYKPVRNVIDEIAASVNEITPHVREKVARLVFPVIREINLHVTPNIRAIRVNVESTSSAPMPEDNMRILTAYREGGKGNNRQLYQYGQSTGRVYDLTCDEDSTEERPLPPNLTSIMPPGNLNYMERLGRKDTRFFGFFNFNYVDNRIEFSNATVGDWFVVVYESASDECKAIPVHTIPVIRARVLQRYYEAENPNMAGYYRNEFRSEIQMLKRFDTENFSYQDHLDAITSEYTNAPR